MLHRFVRVDGLSFVDGAVFVCAPVGLIAFTVMLVLQEVTAYYGEVLCVCSESGENVVTLLRTQPRRPTISRIVPRIATTTVCNATVVAIRMVPANQNGSGNSMIR